MWYDREIFQVFDGEMKALQFFKKPFFKILSLDAINVNMEMFRLLPRTQE